MLSEYNPMEKNNNYIVFDLHVLNFSIVIHVYRLTVLNSVTMWYVYSLTVLYSGFMIYLISLTCVQLKQGLNPD